MGYFLAPMLGQDLFDRRPKSCQIYRHDLPNAVVRDSVVPVSQDVADACDVLPRNLPMFGFVFARNVPGGLRDDLEMSLGRRTSQLIA